MIAGLTYSSAYPDTACVASSQLTCQLHRSWISEMFAPDLSFHVPPLFILLVLPWYRWRVSLSHLLLSFVSSHHELLVPVSGCVDFVVLKALILL